MSPSSAHPDTPGADSTAAAVASKLNVPRDVAVSLSQSPAGKSPSLWEQAIRLLLFVVWFNFTCVAIVATQFIGAPLALWDKNIFYALRGLLRWANGRYIANTKKSFGITVTTITQWFAPTPIIISGDESVKDEIKATPDGRVETAFSERIVLIANHLIYSDWLYLWWVAYTSNMHGAIYIILKDSLKWVPLIGWGMQFYGFIFMARKWEQDQPRLAHRLSKLAKATDDPMWLLIFPEGTNLSPTTRPKSVEYAKKEDLEMPKHILLPRSTGLRFCLQNLSSSVHWVYDCTLAYEGVPEGGYPQDYYTLRSLYFEGRPPSGVHMHWRKFHVDEIPLGENEKQGFDKWLQDRYYEKDALLDYFYKHGSFPKEKIAVQVKTEVKLKNPIGDVFSIFAVLALVAVVGRIIVLFMRLFG